MAQSVGESLRSGGELHVVEALARLLRHCRNHARVLDRALQEAWLARGDAEPYRAEAARLVQAFEPPDDPEYFSEDELGTLATFIEAAPTHEDGVTRARALATAIDERRADHFFSWFATACRPCHADDAVPVPASTVVGDELGTTSGLVPPPDIVEVSPPAALPLDGAAHLRLCPRDLGPLTLHYDGRFSSAIDDAAPDAAQIWAALAPTTRWDDQFTFDARDDWFDNVRLKSTEAAPYRERVRRLLGVASEVEAGVVLLPELSVDEATEAMVAEWFRTTTTARVVIAGSRHVADPEGRLLNRARIFVRGLGPDEVLFHAKFRAYETNGQVERIARPNVVTVFGGRRWSFCPLICRDFLAPHARHLLQTIRVRAVLVAALTRKSQLFAEKAHGLAVDAQCLVFVANTPLEPGGHVAAFARPTREAAVAAKTVEVLGEVESVLAHVHTNGSSFKVFTIP